MSAASVFEFRFGPEQADEGVELARRIGADMPPTEGYIRHDVVQDVADAGHVVVITHWHHQAQGEAVLKHYIRDAKVERATELAGAAPSGFLGVSSDLGG